MALCHALAYDSRKALFWNILQAIVEAFDGPWLCLGDFNNILGQWEKMGGNTGDTSNKFLSEFMLNTGAIDFGFNGNKYTWSNKRWGKSCIKERLDKGMCNDDWRMIFPQVVIWHLPATHLDHNLILLDTNVNMRKKGKPFRFETAWSRDASCQMVIQKA